MVTVEVTRLSDLGDPVAAYDRYHVVESAAFGSRVDPATRDSRRPLVEPSRWFLASIDGVDCGGAGSYASELTLPGGATLETIAVSEVGVAPTHRRRGVLSALMDAQLSDAAATGVPVAVLHASEGGIYRRFGYGPAVRWRLARVATRRFRLRDDAPVASGSLQIVAAADAVEVCTAVHDRVRRARAGGLARSRAWWLTVLGDVENYLGGSAKQLVLVHRDDAGRPDGYAIYSVAEDWGGGQADHSLEVWEAVGDTAGVELALWRALIEHDLVGAVHGAVPPDHVLFDVAVDGRQVASAWDQDLLWVRLVDVAAVLAARTYGLDGRLVLDVQDRSGLAAGRVELVVDAGVGDCRASTASADLELSVSDLGELVLGSPSFRRLVRAGRVAELRPGAAGRADAMFGTDPLPWCWVRF